MFGRHDNFSLTHGHVIPGLIHKTYLAKRDNSPLVVCGSGAPLRQFLYAPDLARLLVHVLKDYDKPLEPVNLCVDEEDEISIKEAVSILVQEFIWSYCGSEEVCDMKISQIIIFLVGYILARGAYCMTMWWCEIV